MTVRETLESMPIEARRDVRRAALKWLYRFDAAGTDDIDPGGGLPDEGDEPSVPIPGRGPIRVGAGGRDDDESGTADEPEIDEVDMPDPVRVGFDLATLAWEWRAEADAVVRPLAPEWPTHRQPVIDRSLFRLAWYEVVHGGLPPRVAIDEAIELAREFSTERSPAFVNGVLDRLFRDRLADAASRADGEA